MRPNDAFAALAAMAPLRCPPFPFSHSLHNVRFLQVMCTHEVEVSKGGGPLEEIKIELDDARLKDAIFAEGRQITIWYRIAEVRHVKWNLFAAGPSLFKPVPFPHWWQFQLISLKQIAQFTLLQTPLFRGVKALDIFVPGELLRQPLGFVKPVVLYASLNSPGARELAAELDKKYSGISVTEEPPASLCGDVEKGSSSASGGTAEVTHFLLYLNVNTYLEAAGERLAEELRKARVAQLPIVMAHENDPALGGCEFGRFFSTTPADLIGDGLYTALALACYPGEHRAASMALLAKCLGAEKVTGAALSDLAHQAGRRLSRNRRLSTKVVVAVPVCNNA